MNSELLHIPEVPVNKPVIFLSDFDMTLANSYVYSESWQTHVPILDRELVSMLKKQGQQLCVATARGAREPVSWMIAHRLLDPTIPLVVENGAALLWKRSAVSTPPSIELLIDEGEVAFISELEREIVSQLPAITGVHEEHTILVRENRIASIELRAEHASTHKGTPEEYVNVSDFLSDRFPDLDRHCDILATGSSLTIQSKSANKSTGVRAALARANIDISSVFPIGLGDNRNDTPIFFLARELGGIAIGVSGDVDENACDLVFEGGETATKRIVQSIQSQTL
jgi:hydroxymethylpyrimidine pyrophosphatase-like HAD family hydrolase